MLVILRERLGLAVLRPLGWESEAERGGRFSELTRQVEEVLGGSSGREDILSAEAARGEAPVLLYGDGRGDGRGREKFGVGGREGEEDMVKNYG